MTTVVAAANVPALVQSFNTLLEMFLADLSATVQVASVHEAHGWVSALISVDPSNDTVLRLFMKMLQGAQESITSCNASFFQNFDCMPSLISQADMYEIYKGLGEADRKVCWKYFSKLYKNGKRALEAMHIDEGVETVSTVDLKAQLQDMMSNGPLAKITGSTGGSNALEIPDGPIVIKAFNTSCQELLDLLVELVPKDAHVKQLKATLDAQLSSGQTDNLDMMNLYSTQFPTDVGFMTDAEGSMRQNGVPFLQGGAKKAEKILNKLSDDNLQRLTGVVQQLGTIAMALQSIDASMISQVEDVARNFISMMNNGDVDLESFVDDPVAMLQKLTESGLCDDLLAVMERQSVSA